VKKGRVVYFVRENDGMIIKKVNDPLGLTRFFPIATPVQAIEVTGRLTPVNPFSIYSKLADELDRTTKRINVITKQLKVKGFYAISPTDLQAVLDADDNEFTPISDGEIWAKNGGLQNAIMFWPVERLIIVLKELYALREQTKQAIYEITGISDIVRGASKATETLGAQQIKSQWGSLRIQKMQRMMERAARDLFVMMAEIIPEKFSPETLQKMTDIQLIPTQQDLQPVPQPQVPQGAPPEMAQQAAQEVQQAEQARMLKLKHLEMIQALMKEKLSAYYRIDVETDSTIKADLSRQKAEASEFMTAASGYFTAVGPLVQQGVLPPDVAVEIFSSFSRMFNLGKSVEDALDSLIATAKQKASEPAPPDPAAAAGQAEDAQRQKESEQRMAEVKGKLDALAIEGQIKQDQARAKIQAETEERANRLRIEMMEAETANAKARQEIEAKNLDLQIKIVELRIKEVELAQKQQQPMGLMANG